MLWNPSHVCTYIVRQFVHPVALLVNAGTGVASTHDTSTMPVSLVLPASKWLC
jgi:hypothetical protein